MWRTLYLLLLVSSSSLVFLSTPSLCQNAGSDMSQDDMGNQDELAQQDPNLVNPQNRQGYGREVPQQVLKTDPQKSTPDQKKKKTMAEMTVQAALQMGVLVRGEKCHPWRMCVIVVTCCRLPSR